MLELTDSIRSAQRTLAPSSVLKESTSVLLGVSQAAADALNQVGITSIFDLASSTLFSNAVDICLLAESGEGRFALTGKVPSDVLREGHAIPLADLPLQSVSILNTSSPKTTLTALATAIDIGTIRDLAVWPPYRTARQFLDRVYNPLSLALDGEAPADLVPANGQYPTERVQYEVLLFDQFAKENPDAAPQPLSKSGPLDISKLMSTNEGYEHPAIGGVLTFTQSWFTKGLSLGNLIHSVALGPGESTKIAMIDWSRKTRTSATEDVTETELLTSEVTRTRSINEITEAVARETQRGESGAKGHASATQIGTSTGKAGFRDITDSGSLLTSPGVTTSGTSFGLAIGDTESSSWSTSTGERNVGASLTQDITDRTYQASHSARDRRASIVREVSQQESESISTRTLTN